MDAETQRFLADLMGAYRGAVHRRRTIAEERAVLAVQALLLADELTATARRHDDHIGDALRRLAGPCLPRRTSRRLRNRRRTRVRG